jgi:hypothetical protein
LDDQFFIGFLHFHHMGTKPQDFPYPYSDFVHTVYAARAKQYFPGARELGELESAFHPVVEARSLPLGLCQRFLLETTFDVILPKRGDNHA